MMSEPPEGKRCEGRAWLAVVIMYPQAWRSAWLAVRTGPFAPGEMPVTDPAQSQADAALPVPSVTSLASALPPSPFFTSIPSNPAAECQGPAGPKCHPCH